MSYAPLFTPLCLQAFCAGDPNTGGAPATRGVQFTQSGVAYPLPVGEGVGWRVTLSVGGQDTAASQPLFFDFMPPTVTAVVAYDGRVGLPTSVSDTSVQMLLVGTNFGAPWATSGAVVPGGAGGGGSGSNATNSTPTTPVSSVNPYAVNPWPDMVSSMCEYRCVGVREY